jgi:hypothetical protein
VKGQSAAGGIFVPTHHYPVLEIRGGGEREKGGNRQTKTGEGREGKKMEGKGVKGKRKTEFSSLWEPFVPDP